MDVDVTTCYTTIPYSKLIDVLKELVQLLFIKKNYQRRYKYFGFGMENFISTNKFSDPNIIKMVESSFFINNICVMLGERAYQ
jgi:hypothetical protein